MSDSSGSSSEAIPPKLSFRQAKAADLEAIVAMLADDPLGAQREALRQPLPGSYRHAFAAIEADPNNELVLACLPESTIAGVLQLTFIPSITYQGRWRALIEGVRVDAHCRGQGIGRAMFQWAEQRARERHCHMLQLTTDKARPDALRFYQSLGFVASHEGMKMRLESSSQVG